ncbi:hypothetical protein, partial [Pseudomonas sp. FEN]
EYPHSSDIECTGIDRIDRFPFSTGASAPVLRICRSATSSTAGHHDRSLRQPHFPGRAAPSNRRIHRRSRATDIL